jgi:hypothetical protein
LNEHGLDDRQLAEVLTHGELDIEGRLIDASNLAVVAIAQLDGVWARCVYKPSAGERPLWDFDTATLSRREVAAYQVSSAAGWNVVPVTVWREDGPAGEGMCQVWIDVDEQAGLVDIVPLGAVPEGWKHVIDAEGSTGRPVTLVHADHDPPRQGVGRHRCRGGQAWVHLDREQHGHDSRRARARPSQGHWVRAQRLDLLIGRHEV